MATIGTGWIDGAWVQAGWAANAWSNTASASITGTASSGLTETQIVNGGETIIITLIADTWVAAGATFNAQRQNIIDGITSAQSEATGWNAEVRDKEVVTAVARTSDTVVTITLSAAAAYDVTADETITVTIPATALTGATEVVATPTLAITADAAVSTAKGRRKARKPRRYIVEVDGQFIPVSSIAEAESVLLQVRELAEEAAKSVKSEVTPKPPRVAIKTASGKPTTSKVLRREVKQTQTIVNRIYRQAAKRIAVDNEIARLMSIKIAEERDEEEAILALLL